MEISAATFKTKREWLIERESAKRYKLGTFELKQLEEAILEHEKGILDARERRSQIFGFRMVHFLEEWLQRLKPDTESDLPREVAVGHRFIAEGGSYVEGTVFRDWRKQRTKERGARDAALRGPHVKESGLTFYEESDKTRPDQDFFPQATIVTFFDNKEYNKMMDDSSKIDT